MKPFLWIALLMICLLLPLSSNAEKNSPAKEDMSQMQILLNKYQAEGYDFLGPVQYLGKNKGRVQLHRNDPVSYKKLTVINADGQQCFVRKYDFVYVLSDEGNVILICVEREGQNNA